MKRKPWKNWKRTLNKRHKIKAWNNGHYYVLARNEAEGCKLLGAVTCEIYSIEPYEFMKQFAKTNLNIPALSNIDKINPGVYENSRLT